MAEKKMTLIGGQAVIEGVMMKGPKGIVTSVRRKDGKIVSRKEVLPKSSKLSRIIFLRGIANLIEMLVVGIRALVWSSNQALDDEEEEEEFGAKEIALLLIVSFGFAIGFFVALPYFLTHVIGFKETASPVLFNLIDGIIKIALFFAYLISISFMKDIRRLFEFHGAEHMSVYCYEAKKELTVENVKKYATEHPRCGTSFIIIVLIISILIFALIPTLVLWIYPGFEELGFWIQKSVLFPLRILFIPVVAGISYEVLRITAKHDKNPLFKVMTLPGLLTQKITTKKPDDRQLEVAIHALKQVI